jgi:NSS family neurotransmitter:Na+ symporter
LTSEKAAEGLSFLLRPRFSELSWNGVLAALGQAFFSLSLGMGAMITYGSYLEQKRNVARAGLMIVVMDTAVAVLAGLVIFPLVFSYGLNPAEGPSLVFVVLPEAFVRMPATTLLATTFFALLLFAALTSAISLLEVVVSFVCDELGWSRIAAAWMTGALIYLLGVPSVAVAGFLDWADWLASSIMLPVGGFFIALFVGWWLPVEQLEAAYAGQEDHSGGFRSWRLCIRYLAPVAVGVILLQKIWIPN